MMKKETIGKIQVVLGILFLVMGILLVFFIIPGISGGIGLTDTNNIISNIMKAQDVQGYANFSNEAKAQLNFEENILISNVSNLLIFTKLISLSIISISIILSIMLMLQGLTNITKER